MTAAARLNEYNHAEELVCPVAGPVQMNIVVAPYGWAEARPRDIEALLRNVASHMNRFLRPPFAGTIIVVPAPCDDWGPRTHYRPSTRDPFFIQLTARGRKWAQFAYQFSHELCHVLSDYERLREGPNNWFHEAICELASVFTLRRMAERWPICPPYPNWTEYSEALAKYAVELLSHQERRLPAGATLRDWLSTREDELRKDPRQRDKNAVVAHSLLPIFESQPAGWNAIRSLPDSSATFGDYLLEWHARVEPANKPFVKRILEAFE